MNLEEFIKYRSHCPICDTALVTQFISDRKQKIKLIDNRLVVIFVMKALRVNQPDYEVGYSFNPSDNTFQVEFYSEWDHYDSVPIHLIDKFKEFHKNLGKRRFFRRCTFCNKYALSSTLFELNFKTRTFDSKIGFDLGYEAFGLTLPVEDGFKIMYLTNFHMTNQSNIKWFRSDRENDARLDWPVPTNHSNADVAFLPFVSKEETTKRLNTLITFA